MRSLLSCDYEDLIGFCDALTQIGETSASEWIHSNLEDLGKEKLEDERFLLSDEFLMRTRELDESNDFYRDTIDRSLATFLRRHREEALPIIAGIAENSSNP